MKKSYYYVLAIAIIAIVLTSGIVIYYNNLPKGPALLSVSLDSFSGNAKSSYSIPVSVYNNGGDVTGVVVKLESSAFGVVTSGSFDIAASKSKEVACSIQISDISPGECPIEVSYIYNGETTIVNNSQSTSYVLPAVTIVEEFWFRAFGYPLVAEKSTIGTNDNTVLSFFIKSDSSLTYSHLTATATLKSGDDSRLTITPNFGSIQDIGPTGKSAEYSFKIVSQNMPPGQYIITIHVFSENHETATKDVTLKVNA